MHGASPLPFPTPAEEVDLRGAYNSSGTRGYLSQQQYASLAERMQVPASSIRQWFNEERMRMGHQGNYHKYSSHPKRRGKPPAVEVRMKLPLSRGKAPSATHTPEAPSATHVPKAKGEYYEEDTPHKVKMDVLWPNSLDSLTMYSFDPEAHELIDGAHGGTHHLLSDNGVESQDSVFGYTSVAEVEVKEHPIDGEGHPYRRAEGRSAAGTLGGNRLPKLLPQPYMGRPHHQWPTH